MISRVNTIFLIEPKTCVLAQRQTQTSKYHRPVEIIRPKKKTYKNAITQKNTVRTSMFSAMTKRQVIVCSLQWAFLPISALKALSG